jgi:hypothetical protein
MAHMNFMLMKCISSVPLTLHNCDKQDIRTDHLHIIQRDGYSDVFDWYNVYEFYELSFWEFDILAAAETWFSKRLGNYQAYSSINRRYQIQQS